MKERDEMNSNKRTDPYATTYHRDHTVTTWNVYSQSWLRTARPSDRLLATLDPQERQRVLHHIGQ